jgi:hypothetical protein
VNKQSADQSFKGAVVGLVSYVLLKNNVDKEFVALLTPVLMGVLAWVSMKVGVKGKACFFDGEGAE